MGLILMATRSEALFVKIIIFVLGVCCFVIAGAGSLKLLPLMRQGQQTQAKVIEITLDRRYQTTNFRRHEAFYRVKVEFVDGQGIKQTRSVNIEPSEKKEMNLAEGTIIPLVYVPGSSQSMISSQLPRWPDAFIPAAAFILLGAAFICFAIIKKD